MAQVTSIAVGHLKSPAKYVDHFLVEIYDYNNSTKVVGPKVAAQTVAAVKDTTSGEWMQQGLITFAGLALGNYYYLKGGPVAPTSGKWNPKTWTKLAGTVVVPACTYTGGGSEAVATLSGVVFNIFPQSVPADIDHYDFAFTKNGSVPPSTATPSSRGTGASLSFFAGGKTGESISGYCRAVSTSGGTQAWQLLHSPIAISNVTEVIDLDDIPDGATYKKVKADTGIQRFKVRAWGNSCQSSQKTDGVWVNGAKQNIGSHRSYNVMVWDRLTMTVLPTSVWGRALGVYGDWGTMRTYDVYASASQAALLAQDLGTASDPNPNLMSTNIVIVWTIDEPAQNRWLNGLPDAMYWCGASAQFGANAGFKVRSAYALIGIPGIGQGNGMEMYRGATNNDYNAWVELTATVIDGDIQGIQSTMTTALTADAIQYSSGDTIDSLKPAAVGADVTANNVSYDSARLNGVGSSTIVGTSGWLSTLGKLTTGTPNRTVAQMEGVIGSDGYAKQVDLASIANGNLDNIGEGVAFKRITADEKRGQSISYDVAALSSSYYSGTVISDATARSGQCLYKTTASSSVLWGPYYNGSQVPSGDCMAIFRVKVDSNAGSTNLVYLDATTGGGATALSGRWLTPSSFETSGSWQDFGLRVRLDANMSSIEFRAVNYSGAVPIYLDTVRVVPVSVDMDVVRDTGNYARTTVTARDTFMRGYVPTMGNLLLNSNFENGLSYWRSDAVLVTDSSRAHSGSNYAQLPATSGGYGLCQTDDRNDLSYPRKIRVRPNEQYYQEVWVYLEGSAGQAGAYCDIYDVGGGYITTVMSNMISTYGQWVKSSQTFTIPSNGAYIIPNAAAAIDTNGVTRVDDALLARLTDTDSLALLAVTADKRGAGCINQHTEENRLFNSILQGGSDWSPQGTPPTGFSAWVPQGVNLGTPAPTLLGTGEAQCYPATAWGDCWSTAYQIISSSMLGMPGDYFCLSCQAKWSSSTQPNGNFYMLIVPQSSVSDTGFSWGGVEYYIPASQLSQTYQTVLLASTLPGCTGGTATTHYRVYFGLRWGTVGGYKWRRPQLSRSIDPPRWTSLLNSYPIFPTTFTPVSGGAGSDAGGDPDPRSGGGSGTQNSTG